MSLIHKKINNRAQRALRKSPFNFSFYEAVKDIGIDAEFVFENKAAFFKKDISRFKSPASIESEFLWLIKIGVLRREVDGQGLTSKVRITPLGRDVFEKNPKLLERKNNYLRSILNCFKEKFIPK